MTALPFGLLLAAASLVTVLRYAATNLHADGVMQSVMSLQGVELFFWGQNRFASVVPFLTAPIAGADANLFAVLLLNAVSFYGMFLVLAWMGANAVAGQRSRGPILLLFLTMVAITTLIVHPYQIYTAALDAQPYSLSWLLTLGAFLLWKRPPVRSSWPWMAAATVMAGIAVGLNQSVVLGAGFLAVVEAVRRGRRRHWLLFLTVWGMWVAVWILLAARFGRTDAVAAALSGSYYRFEPGQLLVGIERSARAVLDAFSPGPLAAAGAAATLAFLVLDRPRRTVLPLRLGMLTVFCLGYLVVLAGNPWVAASQYPARYFFPVLVAVVLALSAPIAAAAAGLARRWDGRPVVRALPIVAVTAGCIAGLTGPLTLPAQAWIFDDVRDTARYAIATDTAFVAGDYWVVWPLVHRLLADGHVVLAANYKAGGDPARYPARLDELVAAGVRARSLCLNDSVAGCQAELDRWTRPGWVVVPAVTCPIAEPPPYAETPARSCRVLEFPA